MRVWMVVVLTGIILTGCGGGGPAGGGGGGGGILQDPVPEPQGNGNLVVVVDGSRIGTNVRALAGGMTVERVSTGVHYQGDERGDPNGSTITFRVDGLAADTYRLFLAALFVSDEDPDGKPYSKTVTTTLAAGQVAPVPVQFGPENVTPIEQ